MHFAKTIAYAGAVLRNLKAVITSAAARVILVFSVMTFAVCVN